MSVQFLREYIDLSGGSSHPCWEEVSYQLLGILKLNHFNGIKTAWAVTRSRSGAEKRVELKIVGSGQIGLSQIQNLLAQWEYQVNPDKISDLKKSTRINDRNAQVYSPDDPDVEDPVVFINRDKTHYLEIRLK